MSVQLVLYPQDYNGYSYDLTPVYNEYVNNPNLYGPLAAIHPFLYGNQSCLGVLVVNAHPPTNVWQGFHANNTGSIWVTTPAPMLSSGAGGLILSSKFVNPNALPHSNCGVYQTISGLVTGQVYQLTVTHNDAGSGATWGALGFGIGCANSGAPYYPLGTTNNTVCLYGTSTVIQFTATNPSMTLWIWYSNTCTLVDRQLTISKISVTEFQWTPTNIRTDLNDGQVICDLYEEETIPLTLSVDEFRNIAEHTQSYSRDFDLPNTKRNNKIFTHIFDVTKVIATSYDFNPYAQTRAVLKENGVIIFDGFLRLIEIKDQEGEISYNVNMFSTTVSLKAILEGRKFKDLDFNELLHEYKRGSITSSWDDGVGLPLTNSLSTDSLAYDAAIGVDNTNVLKYPFVNYKGDTLIATGNNNNATVGYPELLTLGEAFRPWIQIKYIFDKIFKAAGFNYTSTFLSTDAFTKLFMDFSWGTGDTPMFIPDDSWTALGADTDVTIGTSFTPLRLQDGWGNPLPSAYNTGGAVPYSFASTANLTHFYCEFSMRITSTGTSAGTVNCRWAVYTTSTGVATGVTYENQSINIPNNGIGLYTGILPFIVLNNDESIRPEAICGNATYFIQEEEDMGSFPSFVSHIRGNFSSNAIGQAYLLANQRGDIGQWEFVQSIMTMFKLVAMPDPNDTTSLLLEPYNDIFGFNPTAVTPTTRDWTDRVDMSDVTIKPLDLNKTALFKYEEDSEDYNFQIYKDSTASAMYPGLYGCQPININALLGMSGNMVSLLEGNEEISGTPFSSTLCRNYMLGFPELIVPVIYGGNSDGTDLDYIDNLPRILYNCGEKTLANFTYYIPAAFGDSSTNMNAYLQFNHCSELTSTPPFHAPSTANDINFGATQTVGFANYSFNNLYNKYQSEYFTHLHNPNTRIMTVKINLNASDINTFQFYDKIRIKNREYRVNSINYNPGELSVVELIILEFETS